MICGPVQAESALPGPPITKVAGRVFDIGIVVGVQQLLMESRF